MQLREDIFSPSIEKVATRNGYGDALMELGSTYPQVVVLSADLAESMRVHEFQHSYPQRFVEVGVAEQNMMGIAAGLALSGKIPFVSSYAVFSPGRNWDQLRVSVCYSKANVKVIGGHAGITVGPDGATHQAMEDLAITRCLPNLVVLCPTDALEAKKATIAAASHHGPVYIRVGREPTPMFTAPDAPFVIGKANVLREGTDVTLIGCGFLVYEALLAAHQLAKEHISATVINCHTIKPIDERAIVYAARRTRAVVTVEEHQIHGGLGSAVSEVLAQNYPLPMKMIGMCDQFGESGKATDLLQKYHFTAPYIVQAAKHALEMATTF